MQVSSQSGTFTEEDEKRYKSAWSRPQAMKSMLNWYRANGRNFLQTEYPTRVSVPTLVLWGANDQFLESDLAVRSLDYCDEGKGVLLGEGTHWVHLEEPGRVNEMIGKFIDAS
ncbi:MAG: alpha/beta hydrolase [Alkalibacterium sp.]|nr:alpha/beta hydrolase [Alkalibacterium sp.]